MWQSDLDFWDKVGSIVGGAAATVVLVGSLLLTLWRAWSARPLAEIRRSYKRAGATAAAVASRKLPGLALRPGSRILLRVGRRFSILRRRMCVRSAIRAVLDDTTLRLPMHDMLASTIDDEAASLIRALETRLVAGTRDDVSTMATIFFRGLAYHLARSKSPLAAQRASAVTAWLQRSTSRPESRPPEPMADLTRPASSGDAVDRAEAARPSKQFEGVAGAPEVAGALEMGAGLVIDMVNSSGTPIDTKVLYLTTVLQTVRDSPAYKRALYLGQVMISEVTDGAALVFWGESLFGSVACADEVRERLARDQPDATLKLAVRMGVHVGLFARLGGGGRPYATGDAIEHASRVMSAAPPRQVYVSAEAAIHLRKSATWAARVVDVGEVAPIKGPRCLAARLEPDHQIAEQDVEGGVSARPRALEDYLRFVFERDSVLVTRLAMPAHAGGLSMEDSHAKIEAQYDRVRPLGSSDDRWGTRTWTLEDLVDEVFLRGEVGGGRRWHLFGDPGTGKTTELRHLCWRLARRSPSTFTPILIALPRLASQTLSVLEFAAAAARLEHADRRALVRELETLAEQGRVAFLLDAADEVEPRYRHDAEEHVAALCARYAASLVLIAGRPFGSPARSGFRTLTLLSLDRAARVKLVAGLIADGNVAERRAQAESLVARLERSPYFWQHTANPLYLTLLAVLVRSKRTPSESLLDLHLQVVDLLLGGEMSLESREPRSVRNPTCAMEVLQLLAYAMTEAGVPHADQKTLERWLQQDMELAAKVSAQEGWGSLASCLADVRDVSGVLGPFDGPLDWRFWHPAMRDALAAAHLQTRLEAEADAIRRADDDRDDDVHWWTVLAQRAIELQGVPDRKAEMYALLASRAENRDELLLAFARADSGLGMRALATAKEVSPDTVREVLGLTADWQRRRVVIERVARIKNQATALELLERVRSCVRTGNDFFFLQRAVMQHVRTGRAWSPHAQQILKTLFGNIAPPNPELFRHVPGHPSRAFWIDIAGGTATLPPLDGGAPRVIRTASAFRLSAVPITTLQFRQFDAARSAMGFDHHPITDVTWFEATMFCAWLAQLPEFADARLPQYAEWAFACHRETTPWWAPATIDAFAWSARDSGRRVQQVATKQPTGDGLFDLLGNVNQWCIDIWREDDPIVGEHLVTSAAIEVSDDPDAQRTFCGGSYLSAPTQVDPSLRFRAAPLLASPTTGFRVLLPPTAKDSRLSP